MEKAFPRALEDLTDFEDDESTRKQQVRVFGDNSNFMVTGEIHREIYDSLKRVGERVDKIAEGVEIPIEYVNPPIYGREPAEFEDFMLPGILAFLVFGTSFALAQLTLLPERKEGLTERARSSGVQPYQIVFAYILSQIGVLIIQIVIRLIMIFFIFQIPLNGSFILTYSLLILQGVVGMAGGITTSSCFKTEQEAMFISMPIYFLIMLSGGIFNPIESMPGWMQSVSYFLPTTFPCIALRSIIARGWGISYLVVQLGFLSSGLYIVLLLSFSVFMLQFNL